MSKVISYCHAYQRMLNPFIDQLKLSTVITSSLNQVFIGLNHTLLQQYSKKSGALHYLLGVSHYE